MGDLSLIPGLGGSPGGEHGNLLRYSWLENLTGQRSLAGYSPRGSQRVGQNWAIKHSTRKVKSLSRVWHFATPWTVAYQAPPSMGFSRQECWSRLPSPSPGIFPTQESNPGPPHCRQTLYRLSHQGIPKEDKHKIVQHKLCKLNDLID